MARPPLVLGTWGKITRVDHKDGGVAFARFRDYDGVTRQVERKGKTPAAAERELLKALRDRAKLPSEDIAPETRVNRVADDWWAALQKRDVSEGTRVIYSQQLKHIRKGVGALQLRELTVPAVDRFLEALTISSGPESARLSRVVLSGICKLAVRKGAMDGNPVRDAGPTPRGKTVVQTVDVDAVVVLRKQLKEWDAGKDGGGRVRQTDLADAVDMILGTAARTGEIFAIREFEDLDIDSDPATVTISGTVVFQKGAGHVRQPHPKSDQSFRELKLPQFVVDMLLRRRGSSVSGYVFESSAGTLRSPNNFRRQWRDFREAHGYEDWIVPKTFRKAAATLIEKEEKENGLKKASGQLGHSSEAVTQKHYVKSAIEGPDVRETLQLFAS